MNDSTHWPYGASPLARRRALAMTRWREGVEREKRRVGQFLRDTGFDCSGPLPGYGVTARACFRTPPPYDLSEARVAGDAYAVAGHAETALWLSGAAWSVEHGHGRWSVPETSGEPQILTGLSSPFPRVPSIVFDTKTWTVGRTVTAWLGAPGRGYKWTQLRPVPSTPSSRTPQPWPGFVREGKTYRFRAHRQDTAFYTALCGCHGRFFGTGDVVVSVNVSYREGPHREDDILVEIETTALY